MAKLATLTVLRQSAAFGALPRELLDELVDLSQLRQFSTGEVLFREGEPGTTLFGVISGRIRVQLDSGDGRALNLMMIEAGEVVGEIAFLDGGLRTATGEAAESTTCFAIQRTPFLNLLHKRPELAIHLLQLVCGRVRRTSHQVADFAFLTPAARMARRLLSLAALGYDSVQSTEVKISQAELAKFLGVSRQVVNGHLREWQRRGAVRLGHGRITLVDSVKMLDLAGLPS